MYAPGANGKHACSSELICLRPFRATRRCAMRERSGRCWLTHLRAFMRLFIGIPFHPAESVSSIRDRTGWADGISHLSVESTAFSAFSFLSLRIRICNSGPGHSWVRRCSVKDRYGRRRWRQPRLRRRSGKRRQHVGMQRFRIWI